MSRSALPLLVRPPFLIALVVGTLLAGTAFAGPTDGYHDADAVASQLRSWAQGSSRVQLLELGTSAGGTPLLGLRIAASGELDPDERPAVFVAGNPSGDHPAGTEAALDLARHLIELDGPAAELLAGRTFYVVPVANPDAHGAFFGAVRWAREGNAQPLDGDRDGLVGEDGPDDLDGDGRITWVRIPDPTGRWLPHPDDPRLMVEEDASRDWIGTHRLEIEGHDDDRDGQWGEDPPSGVHIDRSFPHAFPFPMPEAGPWSSWAPETKALLDFVLGHRNIAAAVVYGKANNFLEAPRSLGGGGDLGTQKFKIPEQAAEFLGFDPELEYTIDEVWEVAKDLPFVRQNNITKDQLAQFLGAGPATKLADDDLALLSELGDDYKERLEAAGLDPKRPVEQYRSGGLTPWLYYQTGALALELDVWGVPKPEKEESEDAEEGEAPLTLERLKEMSSDELLALSDEVIEAFLREIGAPAQFTAAGVRSRVEGGQVTPAQMAMMAEQMGAGEGGGGDDEGEDDPATQRRREVLDWMEAHHPEAVAPWTSVTLPDGTVAEAGGLDPFAATTPPRELLHTAIEAHTTTVVDLAARLAEVRIRSVSARALGGGVWEVRAVVENPAPLPTHSQQAVRSRARIPVRLALVPGEGVEAIPGAARPEVAERLEAETGRLEARWMVRGSEGDRLTVEVRTDQAGRDTETLTLSNRPSR